MELMMVGEQEAAGAFWAVYPDGGAAEECLVDPGTEVDISCCAAMTPSPLISSASNGTSCFQFAPGVNAFKGCEDGVSMYGEFCGGGDPGDFDIEECGCQFQVMGTGCFKANDFPDDPRQFFVYLDDDVDCKGDDHGMSGMMDDNDLSAQLKRIEEKLDMLLSGSCPGDVDSAVMADEDPDMMNP